MKRSQTAVTPLMTTNSKGKQKLAAGNAPSVSNIQNTYSIDESQKYMACRQYVDQRDLFRCLSEKDVDIEDLGTSIVALASKKEEVLKDTRKEVFAMKDHLRGSKNYQYELQQQLIETSSKCARRCSYASRVCCF